MSKGKSVVDHWAFWWPCSHCSKLKRFMVDEASELYNETWGRCPTCTALIRVTDEHRESRAV